MDLKSDLDKLFIRDFDAAQINVAYCIYDILKFLGVEAKMSANKKSQIITFYLPQFDVELLSYKEIRVNGEVMVFSRRKLVELIKNEERD